MQLDQEPDRSRRNLGAALGLAAAGIAVFPAIVKPGNGAGWDKQPLIKGWQSKATTDRSEINGWWRQWPHAVPGIPLKGHVVVDADRHGTDGVEALDELVAIHGDLPLGPVTETAGGGLHYVFRQPPAKRLGNSRGSLPAGVDVRGSGGWIVAPGSIRPDGKLWAPRSGTPLLAEAFRAGTIPEIPAWLVEMIEARTHKAPATPGPGPAHPHNFGPYAQRALMLICDDLRRAQPGTRNTILNNAAVRVGSMVARGWLDQHDALDCITEAGLACGLPPDEVQKTLASGFTAGLAKPALDPKDRPQSQGSALQRTRATGSKPAFNWRAGAISATALLVKVFPDIIYIVPGILPEGVTLLVGRPKIGKSWWALDLCIAVASENLLFMGGVQPGNRGDVLYLALEDNQRRLQRRLKKLLGKAKVPNRLTFHTEWSRVDQGGIEAMKEWLDEHPHAKLVVVDTLQKIRPIVGNDGYAKDYMAIEPLQKLAGERGISILVLHHDRKADAEDVFDTISGTLGLTGSTDAMLVLKRDPNVRFVLHGRGRDIEEFEKAMSFDKDTCVWRMLGNAEEEKRSKERKAIVAVISVSKEAMGPKEIAAECRMKEANVKVLVGKMVTDGTLERADGKYRLREATDGNR